VKALSPSLLPRPVSRGQFLRSALGLTAAVGATVAAPNLTFAAGTSATSSQTAGRSYSAGHIFLSVGGSEARLLHTFGGGDPYAEVNKERNWEGVIEKHLGPLRYSEMELEVGFNVAKSFYDWLRPASGINNATISGSVLLATRAPGQVAKRNFSNAGLISITVPALDARSNDAA
jgi:hypothetical protein